MDSINILKDRLKDLVPQERIDQSQNGISLLDLKNEALLSYLNNLALVIGAKLQNDDQLRLKATKATIEQRVTLEKGIKGLEAKVSYQIDKALRAFKKMEENEQKEQQESDSDSESDSDEDLTAYKPNVEQLKAAESDDEDESAASKYKAPKIAKTAITQKDRRHKRRDFAMEEYLRDHDDAPVAEPSIGSAIMDSGRGGQSTEFERRKDREIQEFEEANFTRLATSGKKARKEAAKRQRDAMSRNAFGENWDFLEKGEKREKRRRK